MNEHQTPENALSGAQGGRTGPEVATESSGTENGPQTGAESLHAQLAAAIRDCPARYPDDIATAVLPVVQRETARLRVERDMALATERRLRALLTQVRILIDQQLQETVMAEPEDTCRPVEVDGETIRVRGSGEMTAEDQEALAALVRAAKAKFEADAPEKVGELQTRLRLAHQARRGKEHQLDDIRRALCDIGFMDDGDPYSHADLADVIRQALHGGTGYCPHCGRGDLAPAADEYEQQRQRAERAEADMERVRAARDRIAHRQQADAIYCLDVLDEALGITLLEPAATEAIRPTADQGEE